MYGDVCWLAGFHQPWVRVCPVPFLNTLGFSASEKQRLSTGGLSPPSLFPCRYAGRRRHSSDQPRGPPLSKLQKWIAHVLPLASQRENLQLSEPHPGPSRGSEALSLRRPDASKKKVEIWYNLYQVVTRFATLDANRYCISRVDRQSVSRSEFRGFRLQ